MDKSWQQLKRLRGDLEDMVGMYQPFGFGILRPSPPATVTTKGWELAEETCEPCFAVGDRHLHLPPSWLDPAPDRTYCIRWWGDKRGVEAFKKWGTKLHAFFRQYRELATELFVPSVTPVLPSWAFSFEPPVWEPSSGYYWTLNVLGMLATKHPQLKQTKEQMLLSISNTQEVQVIPTKQRHFGDDDTEQTPVMISFLEIEADSITLGLRSLDQISGELPPLQVDVENGVIYFQDKPVSNDRLQAEFVAIIVTANGGWVSGNDIREKLELSEDDRIDRTIYKKLPREVRDHLESSGGKGYRYRRKMIRLPKSSGQ